MLKGCPFYFFLIKFKQKMRPHPPHHPFLPSNNYGQMKIKTAVMIKVEKAISHKYYNYWKYHLSNSNDKFLHLLASSLKILCSTLLK